MQSLNCDASVSVWMWTVKCFRNNKGKTEMISYPTLGSTRYLWILSVVWAFLKGNDQFSPTLFPWKVKIKRYELHWLMFLLLSTVFNLSYKSWQHKNRQKPWRKESFYQYSTGGEMNVNTTHGSALIDLIPTADIAAFLAVVCGAITLTALWVGCITFMLT